LPWGVFPSSFSQKKWKLLTMEALGKSSSSPWKKELINDAFFWRFQLLNQFCFS